MDDDGIIRHPAGNSFQMENNVEAKRHGIRTIGFSGKPESLAMWTRLYQNFRKKESKMALKILGPTELQVPEWYQILLYGEINCGKTTTALSMPDPLLVDVDRGLHRVNKDYRGAHVQPTTWAECQQVFDLPLGKFKTIVIDTVNKLLNLALLEVQGGTNALNQNIYQQRNTLFKNFIARLAASGKHIVYCSQLAVVNKKSTSGKEMPYHQPAISDSAALAVYQDLDAIGFVSAGGADAGKTIRQISFNPTDTHLGKNGIGKDGVFNLPVLGNGAKNDYLARLVEEMREAFSADQEIRQEANLQIESYKTLASECDTAEQFNNLITQCGEEKFLLDAEKKAKMAIVEAAKEKGFTFKDRKCVDPKLGEEGGEDEQPNQD